MWILAARLRGWIAHTDLSATMYLVADKSPEWGRHPEVWPTLNEFPTTWCGWTFEWKEDVVVSPVFKEE